MSPFIANPFGLSPDSLKLLDRALSGIWRDQLLKNAKAGAKEGHRSTAQPAPAEPPASAKREIERRAPASKP